MNELGKKLGIITLSIAFVCLVSTPGWAITIAEVKTFISGLPVADFNNADADIKASTERELDAVADTLTFYGEEEDPVDKAELKQDAIDSLTKIKDKNSGCVISGSPGEDDSLVNCTSQTSFHSQLEQLIGEIEAY